jgi:recombinational DNA repair protein RecT
MDETYLNIETLDKLITALQNYRQKYGNISVDMDMSVSKDEGSYDIDAVLYSVDEDGKKSISLISW